MVKNALVMNMRFRTLPSQNACRVKAHGSTLSIKISTASLCLLFGLHGPIYVRLDHDGLYFYKMVCMDVRLLLFSFCVFSEH